MDGIGQGPKVVFEIGPIRITETVVTGWIIIVAVLFVCLWLTRGLKKIPDKKRQIIAEMFVKFVNGLVKENMGAKLVCEASSKTNSDSGDGTTTAIVLAQALVNNGLDCVANGAKHSAILSIIFYIY